MKQIILTAASLLALSACVTAPTTKYEWGNYEQSMYGYYKSADKATELTDTLAGLIKTAEASKRAVAPGIYAEYGYLLMIQGRQKDAIFNFEKEKSTWPESGLLMDRMSKMASAQNIKTEVK